MNNSPSYEQLIAQKIVQLPAPALEDSIWASIEAQLDMPLPGDELPGPPAKNPPGKGLPGGAKLLYVAVPVVVIATAILLFTGHQKENQKQEPLPGQVMPAADKKPDSLPPPPRIPLQEAPTGFPSQQKDSVNPVPAASLPLPDTTSPVPQQDITTDTVATVNPLPPPVRDTALHQPGPAKPKGVKGIKDTDYKIKTERKDSTDKKN